MRIKRLLTAAAALALAAIALQSCADKDKENWLSELERIVKVKSGEVSDITKTEAKFSCSFTLSRSVTVTGAGFYYREHIEDPGPEDDRIWKHVAATLDGSSFSAQVMDLKEYKDYDFYGYVSISEMDGEARGDINTFMTDRFSWVKYNLTGVAIYGKTYEDDDLYLTIPYYFAPGGYWYSLWGDATVGGLTISPKNDILTEGDGEIRLNITGTATERGYKYFQINKLDNSVDFESDPDRMWFYNLYNNGRVEIFFYTPPATTVYQPSSPAGTSATISSMLTAAGNLTSGLQSIGVELRAAGGSWASFTYSGALPTASAPTWDTVATGLTPATTYEARTFVKTRDGDVFYSGNTVTFTTSPGA